MTRAIIISLIAGAILGFFLGALQYNRPFRTSFLAAIHQLRSKPKDKDK